MIYKCSKRSSKIEFLCNILPTRYKRLLGLFKQTSRDNFDIIEEMKKFGCFDQNLNLDKQKLRIVMVESLIRADSILNTLTDYFDYQANQTNI